MLKSFHVKYALNTRESHSESSEPGIILFSWLAGSELARQARQFVFSSFEGT